MPTVDHKPAAFAFIGGALCLDFVNSVYGRTRSRQIDTICAYGDLLRWSVAAFDLDQEQVTRLEALAAGDRAGAESVLRRGLVLREALFEVFTAVTAGRRPAARELEVIDGELARIIPRLCHLRWTTAGPELGWSTTLALDRPLWNVLRSAIDLLVSDQRRQVKQCEAPTCLWFFIDETRNRSRRWCDMAVCGNRAKARRARARQRSTAGA